MNLFEIFTLHFLHISFMTYKTEWLLWYKNENVDSKLQDTSDATILSQRERNALTCFNEKV